MNKFEKLVYKLLKRSYYITYEWTNEHGDRIQSWRIVDTTYNLNKAAYLLKFIKEHEDKLQGFYITWFKELK